jgi:hypothetical protein
MASTAAMLPKAVAPGMDVDMPDVLGLPTGKGAGTSQTDLYSRMKALQKHLQVFLDKNIETKSSMLLKLSDPGLLVDWVVRTAELW